MHKLEPKKPVASWSLNRIAEYTLSKLEEIHRVGKFTAKQTYLVGKALSFAYARLRVKGEWQKWLDKQEIPQKTAWEAIELYKAVKNEDDLTGLTSTEAKVKYSIYSGFPSSSSGDSRSSESVPLPALQTNEDYLNLAYHRIKAAFEAIHSIKNWDSSILYSTEADDCIKFAKEIQQTITAIRRKVKPSGEPKTIGKLLGSLDQL
ncbi:MAG: hypothetical protein ACXABY_18635 [Candidatus Thorarchaeota archaeon]|jgi:hypothetical protein